MLALVRILIVNSNIQFHLIGKTCEDVRKYKKILLLKDVDKILKKMSKFTFISFKQYGEDLIALDMKKEEVVLDKPRYIGTFVQLLIIINYNSMSF